MLKQNLIQLHNTILWERTQQRPQHHIFSAVETEDAGVKLPDCRNLELAHHPYSSHTPVVQVFGPSHIHIQLQIWSGVSFYQGLDTIFWWQPALPRTLLVVKSSIPTLNKGWSSPIDSWRVKSTMEWSKRSLSSRANSITEESKGFPRDSTLVAKGHDECQARLKCTSSVNMTTGQMMRRDLVLYGFRPPWGYNDVSTKGEQAKKLTNQGKRDQHCLLLPLFHYLLVENSISDRKSVIASC